MKQTLVELPAMPQMEFAVTHTTLDRASPLNQNEAHIHRDCEVYLNLSGDVSFSVEDRLYPVSRGSVILTRPYEYHHCIYRGDAPHEHYWITFSTAWEQEFLRPFFHRQKGRGNRIILPEETLQQVCTLLDSLLDGALDELEKRVAVLRFFGLLTKASAPEEGELSEKLPQDVAAALRYLDAHLTEDVAIDALAAACGVSVNTLERHFRESLGVTPFAMLRKKRLFASMLYLRSGCSVTEAAQQSGFCDDSRYIVLFRRQFGMTPGKYKKLFAR